MVLVVYVLRANCHSTCGLVAMTSAQHAEGRQFDPGQVYAGSAMCHCQLRGQPLAYKHEGSVASFVNGKDKGHSWALTRDLRNCNQTFAALTYVPKCK